MPSGLAWGHVDPGLWAPRGDFYRDTLSLLRRVDSATVQAREDRWASSWRKRGRAAPSGTCVRFRRRGGADECMVTGLL